MASFDFIEASAKAMGFCWKKRSYLTRVAVPVLFVKIFCILTAFVMVQSPGSLTYGLIVFPSYVIEGIYVAGLIRYFVYKEPIYVWGKHVIPPEQTPESFKPHSPFSLKPIQAGIAVYCLMWLIIHFIGGITLTETLSETQQSDAASSMSSANFLFSTLMFLLSLYIFLWSIRLLFIHIPLVLDIPARVYFHTIRGIKTSVIMLLTILIVTTPVLIAKAITLNILELIFPDGSAPYIVGEAFISAFGQCIETSILSVAIAYGICNMFASIKYNEKI